MIASFDDEAEAQRYRTTDNADLSHVTMRTRAWWDALFRKSGWQLDPLQRLGAERCQAHALPRKMQWKLYVYAPR